MSLFRTVQASFWTDVKITEDFSPEDRYFYLYLFTNPHTNLCGCYEVSIKQIANEVGFNADKVEHLLEKFANSFFVAKYSSTTREVLLINWHKYNWNVSSKLRVAVKNEIDNIKCNEFREYLTSVFNDEEPTEDIKQFGMDNNTADAPAVIPEKKTRSVFTPPTVEEVKAYCQERKNNVDPERFVDFYTTKGWRVGKDPMKDWKACVRTWEKNSNTNGQQQLKPAVTTNKFQQFPQREYTTEDYDALERRKLLGK